MARRSAPDLTGSEALGRLTQLAGRVLDAPVACASLVDADRRLWTSSCGLPAPAALLVSWSFMKQVVASRRPLVVTDGRTDPVAARNPAVRDGMVTAYVGMPLVAPDGRAVGTLSVMDRKPRRWTATQLDLLRTLSVRIVGEVERVAAARSSRGNRRLSARRQREAQPLDGRGPGEKRKAARGRPKAMRPIPDGA